MNEFDEDRVILATAYWPEARRRKVGRAVAGRAAARPTRSGAPVLAGAVAGFLLVAGALAGMALQSRREPAVAPPVAAMRASGRPSEIDLPDGSTVRLHPGATLLPLAALEPGRVELHLGSGTAEFRVARRRARLFRVLAGRVTVEVRGTQFRVDRLGAGAVIAVTEGRVAVRWPGGGTELDAGQSGVFPPPALAPAGAGAPPAPAAPEAPAAAAAPAPAPAGRARPGAAAPEPWRPLARRREYERAFRALERSRDVRDLPADLFLAADVARLSQHPERAVEPLTRILERHRRDRRAPLAAFTLGRVLLDDLGRAAAAADAFADAQRLGLDPSLAEHALAREAEARDRAGDRDAAASLARRYLSMYPGGAFRAQVRRYVGAR